MPFETVFCVFALLLGLCIGSFLNVVAWRVPLGRSIVRPGSRCPSCGSDIRWHDNIPVLSWLVLRAKCRDCGGRISARYPLTEAVTGLLFLAAALVRGPGFPFARDAVFLSLLIVTVRTDMDHGGAGIFPAAAAALGGFLLFFLIRLVAGMVLKNRPGYAMAPEGHEHEAEEFSAGMGWGDIKLAACIGAFLGPGPAAVAFFLAFLAGALIGGSLILFRGRNRRVPIPFGPFMALGAAASLFFGGALLNWYLNLWGMR
jgi:leader peptidase (prepilin peptidase)/N-methyltransferase